MPKITGSIAAPGDFCFIIIPAQNVQNLKVWYKSEVHTKKQKKKPLIFNVNSLKKLKANFYDPYGNRTINQIKLPFD